MDKSKITAYQTQIRERDKKIIARYEELISDGYMKTIAMRTVAEEFGFYSTAGINRIVKKYRRDKIVKKDRDDK